MVFDATFNGAGDGSGAKGDESTVPVPVVEDEVVDVDAVDDEDSPVEVDVDGGSDGSADAMPGVPVANPTPRATASAPTRPIDMA